MSVGRPKASRGVLAALFVIGAVLAMMTLIGLAILADLIDRIDTSSHSASQQTCATIVQTRIQARHIYEEQLQRNLDARIPTPEALGIVGTNPADTQYTVALGQALIDGQAAYYRGQLAKFPALHCVERHGRRVPVHKK